MMRSAYPTFHSHFPLSTICQRAIVVYSKGVVGTTPLNALISVRASLLTKRFSIHSSGPHESRALLAKIQGECIIHRQVMCAIMRSKELKVMTRKHPEGISAHELRARIDMSAGHAHNF